MQTLIIETSNVPIKFNRQPIHISYTEEDGHAISYDHPDYQRYDDTAIRQMILHGDIDSGMIVNLAMAMGSPERIRHSLQCDKTCVVKCMTCSNNCKYAWPND